MCWPTIVAAFPLQQRRWGAQGSIAKLVDVLWGA
jgi:hypothetical protein